LIFSSSPQVLLLQETKLSEDSVLREIKHIWKTGEGKAISSRGDSEGICTLWDQKRFTFLDYQQAQHSLLTKMRNNISGNSFSIINVYILNLHHEKLDCWRTLFDILEVESNNDIIVAGDLNTNIYPWEKKGGSLVRDLGREHLEDLISTFHLFDQKPGDGRFTWSKQRTGPEHIAARLDCFLLRSSLLMDSSRITSEILPWASSDHRPILLSFSPFPDLGPIPFRFNPLWLYALDLRSLISTSWSHWVQGSPMHIWEKNPMRLKRDIREWVKFNFKAPKVEIQNTKVQMAWLN
jgi:exonuclease III